MPRTPRLDYPGARHHVMNRTARRRLLFRDDEDLALFLSLLAEVPGRHDARVHGFALMGNHFHLMIEVPRGNLGDVMAFVGGELSRRMNRKHGLEGSLFRGRYLNRAVLDEPYWQHLLAYLHLNPVRAGLIAHPDDSRWTSHRAYAGLDAAPPWLARQELLDLYGSEAQYRAHLDALSSGRALLPDVFDEALLWRQPSTQGRHLDQPASAITSLKPEVALARVAAVADVPVDSLYNARRGRQGNLPRALAAWWLTRAAGLDRGEAGALIGMSASAVGGSAHRVRTADGELARWRDALLEGWLGPETPIEVVAQGWSGKQE